MVLDYNGRVKLIDFGLAISKQDSEIAQPYLFGTDEYLSPEQVNHYLYNESSDWWAFGVVCFELYTKHTPFDLKNKHQAQLTYNNIRNFNYVMRSIISKRAQALIRALLMPSFAWLGKWFQLLFKYFPSKIRLTISRNFGVCARENQHIRVYAIQETKGVVTPTLFLNYLENSKSNSNST